MAEQMEINLPKLRFLGFTGNWGLLTIHQLVDDGIIHPPQDGNHGEIHPKKSDFVERGIPFVMANNIRDGQLDFRNCSQISLEQAETLRKGFAVTGDVLLTHKGTVGETAIVGANEFPFIMLTPQVTFYRVLESDKLDSQFLAVSFGTNQFQDALEEAAGGGTRAYIGIMQQQSLSIALPLEQPEQIQIGSYFKSLDRMIELHQRKHEKLVILKQAMLQKMFPQEGATTPEIRFKGFEGDWEERKVGDLCEDTRGGGTPRTSETRFWDGDIPWVQSSDVIDGRLYSVAPRSWINDLAVRESATHLIPANSIAVVTRVGVGKLALIEYPFATSQDFLSLSRLKIDQQFAVVAFSILFRRKTHQAQGTSIKGITKEELLSYVSPISPHVIEQQKIGTYFRNLDNLISKHATQLKKLKNIKSACLEKMFV